MALENMNVFNDIFVPSVNEMVAQQIEAFNQASNGAIVLNANAFSGDFVRRSFFTSLASARRRVDRYAANGDVASTQLTSVSETGVKIAGGFGPIAFEPSQMTWLSNPTDEGIALASEQFASILVQDQLNTAIAGLVAAISNQSSAVNDVSGAAGITYAALNGAHAKFGDQGLNGIVANVMSGSTAHRLIGENLTTTNRIFTNDQVSVFEILGKPVLVTDAPALYEAGTPNKDKVLGLAVGGAVVSDSSDIVQNIQTNNGKERIETTMQVDYSFVLKLKGYGWDEANGGKSPTDADIGTGSNWDLVATDIKNSAGVIAIGSADA